MGQWEHESTGMEVLRPIAMQQLKDYKKKARIWSDSQEAWGFFANDVSEDDAFLLWCSISPGDRLIFCTLNKEVDSTAVHNNYTVIGVWKKVLLNQPTWIIKVIGYTGQTINIEIEEQKLFRIATKYI